MKISINNFKSIGSLANYEMRPLTILSGTNSSGKSSFIQLLLLLKQTLDDNSRDRVLKLDGDLYPIRKYLDILKNKNIENKLKVKFVFDKSELTKYQNFPELKLYSVLDYTLHIEIEFNFNGEQMVVSSFVVNIVNEAKSAFIKFENEFDIFDIKTNVAIFSDSLYGESYSINKINYSAFIPTDYEMVDENGDNIKVVVKLDGIKAILKDFFSDLNYIGPLRLGPKDSYSINGNIDSIGINGENVAEIICELSQEKITFCRIIDQEDETIFVKTEDTLVNAVKYWICDRFKLCANIYSTRVGDSFIIEVVSLSGVISTIKHVGFGISQILPIIVEGLRISDEETFVLEQPEVHLHPKIQSNLTDFFLSLVKQGKKVIVETHSDHIITRVRRRIAEDQSNKLDNEVLLTFVEVGNNDILFRNIDIDDFGNLDYFPDDFIEKPDTELKAILRAQMKKRFNQI